MNDIANQLVKTRGVYSEKLDETIRQLATDVTEEWLSLEVFEIAASVNFRRLVSYFDDLPLDESDISVAASRVVRMSRTKFTLLTGAVSFNLSFLRAMDPIAVSWRHIQCARFLSPSNQKIQAKTLRQHVELSFKQIKLEVPAPIPSFKLPGGLTSRYYIDGASLHDLEAAKVTYENATFSIHKALMMKAATEWVGTIDGQPGAKALEKLTRILEGEEKLDTSETPESWKGLQAFQTLFYLSLRENQRAELVPFEVSENNRCKGLAAALMELASQKTWILPTQVDYNADDMFYGLALSLMIDYNPDVVLTDLWKKVEQADLWTKDL